MQFTYDAGYVFVIPDPTQDQTPIFIGSLKEITLEVLATFKYESSQLLYKFLPMLSQMKITGIAKFAAFNGRLLGPLFFSQALSTGSTMMAPFEDDTVPAAPGPYTVTVQTPAGGTFSKNLGVFYKATGLPLKLTTGAPNQGQYSVAGGIYTFNAADAGAALSISYLYTVSAGYSFNLDNKFMGPAPLFSLVLMNQSEGEQRVVQLNNCASSKLVMPPVCEKYEVKEFTFECFATKDNIGQVGNFSTAE
jgi:hypothetical protein